MLTYKLALLTILTTLMVGCGAGGYKESRSAPVAPAGNSYGYGHAGAAPSQGSADYAPGAKDSSAGSYDAPARRSEASAAPTTERQGLGTEWGETRTSRVHDTAFERADADRPFATMSVYYNDRAGVNGLIDFNERNGSTPRLASAQPQEVSMTIHDESDDAFETVRLGERSYVVGQAGARYSIVLTNLTGHRIEAVATVDGLDVINGKIGSLHNRGYILMPYATVEIDGFRRSADQVAAFRFGAVGDSYAAKTGSDRNVGVIGVALFNQRGDNYPSDRELHLRDNANPFPASDPRYAQPPRRW
jgi:hypothetical protein